MRISPLLFVIASAARADLMGVIEDRFGETPCFARSCVDTADVIGTRTSFDLQKIEYSIGPEVSTFTIYTDYGAGTAPPSGWTYGGRTLHIGDLLLKSPEWYFGVPLSISSREYRVLGSGTYDVDLYRTNGVKTAQEVLAAPGNWIYRNTAPVWMADGGTWRADATMNVIDLGGDPRYRITVTLNSGILWDELQRHPLEVLFASNTCGNDILDGHNEIPQVPEPATGALTFAVLLVAAGIQRRVRRAR
jgi:hypothetical protein